jgi:hypothetical protein
LIPSPIGKVLSTFRKHRVRALLMGGQACILYGAAEFSRDVDFAVQDEKRSLKSCFFICKSTSDTLPERQYRRGKTGPFLPA